MGVLEKISEIEKEIARTQKNKGICLTYVEKILISEQNHLSERTIFGYIDGVPWSFAHLHIKHSRHTQFMHPLRL